VAFCTLVFYFAPLILGSGFIALLFAGYFAQRSLPPPAPKVVGIDLGKHSIFFFTCMFGIITV